MLGPSDSKSVSQYRLKQKLFRDRRLGVDGLPLPHSRPNMKSGRMIFFLVVVIFAAAIGAVLVRSSRTSRQRTPLSVTFAGSEPGLSYRAAGFYLTNIADVPIGLLSYEVKVASKHGWSMVSSGPVLMLPDPSLGRSNVYYFPKNMPGTRARTPVIQVGGYGKIAVEWTEERPCRVEILYTREARGIEGIITKGKFVWKTRQTSMPKTLWVWPPQALIIDIPK